MSLLVAPALLSSPSCRRSGARGRTSTHARGPAPARANLAEQLLDVIEGGPKLRRWYGAEKKVPRGDAPQPEPEPAEEEPAGDAVLVTEADSALGEALVFALILAQTLRVKLLTRDAASATRRFGDYVQAVSGDVQDAASVRRALRGCTACVVTATVGAVPAECAPAGVAHLLLLGRAPRAGGSNPLAALLQSAAERERAQPAREKVVATAGVPYTVLRLGAELGAPGGRQALWVGTGGQLGGALSVEDAAAVAAAALRAPPRRARVLEVVASASAQGVDAGSAALQPGGEWSAALALLPEQ